MCVHDVPYLCIPVCHPLHLDPTPLGRGVVPLNKKSVCMVKKGGAQLEELQAAKEVLEKDLSLVSVSTACNVMCKHGVLMCVCMCVHVEVLGRVCGWVHILACAPALPLYHPQNIN